MAFLDSDQLIINSADSTKRLRFSLANQPTATDRVIEFPTSDVLAGEAVQLALFGDGSDGTITLSQNLWLVRDMYYDSLTIAAGFTLTRGQFRIFCKGTLTIESTAVLTSSGANGTNASGATAGAGGTRAKGTLGQGAAARFGGGNGATGVAGVGVTPEAMTSGEWAGGYGGNGGAGGTGTAGAGGATATRANLYYWPKGNLDIEMTSSDTVNTPGSAIRVGGGLGGRGGSSGAGDGAASLGGGGGGGGAGGAVAIICARHIVNNGTMSNDGGNGGNGGNASGTASGGGGGGAGGGGGLTLLYYETFTGNTPTVAGGTGGTPGSPTTTGGVGELGMNGGAGKLIRINALTGAFE